MEIGEVLRPRQGAVNVFQLAFHGAPMTDPPFGPPIAPKHREAPWVPQGPNCGRTCKVEKGRQGSHGVQTAFLNTGRLALRCPRLVVAGGLASAPAKFAGLGDVPTNRARVPELSVAQDMETATEAAPNM